ncbi:unnamed protein product [Ambrosiozyma monospora]|uniref:Unnamed protein product n=1 Tax=Ambrosiozyma monospora TaxID=43982 RepID=A0ACB5U375_AMBMO|nr:unnamed protein product [Ambrosiozyma monospora]
MFKRFTKQFSSAFKQSTSRKPYSTYYYFGGQKANNSFQLITLTPQNKKWLIIGGGALFLTIVSHIEEAPVTHRRRIMLTPSWLENRTASTSYHTVKQEYGPLILPQNHRVTRRVRSIMVRLIKAAENYYDPETGKIVNLFEDMKSHSVPVLDWEICVIDDSRRPTPNAFVVGNGKVFVFTSILPLAANDDGLATVLAHELGHQLAHHIGEKLTKSPFIYSIALLLSATFQSPSFASLATQILLDMPSSREMETEADYIGLMLMSKACFNPHEAPRFWQRMLKFEQSMGSVPEILSDHPSSERRNRNILEWIPQADRIYEMANCGATGSYWTGFNMGF